MSAPASGSQRDLNKRPNPLPELHRRLAEGGELFGVSAFDLGRVIQAPMQAVVLPREDGARLASPVAKRDDVVEWQIDKVINGLAHRG